MCSNWYSAFLAFTHCFFYFVLVLGFLGFFLQLARKCRIAKQFLQKAYIFSYSIAMKNLCSLLLIMRESNKSLERSISINTRAKWTKLPSSVFWSIFSDTPIPYTTLKRMLESQYSQRSSCKRAQIWAIVGIWELRLKSADHCCNRVWPGLIIQDPIDQIRSLSVELSKWKL